MKVVIIFIVFLISLSNSLSQRCNEKLLLDGSEPYVSCGFDTTYNWYAITSPYTNKIKVYINDDFISEALDNMKLPTFSADGTKWAFEGTQNGVSKLYTNDTTISIGNYNIGNSYFSYKSNELAYCYSNDASDNIIYRGKKNIANNRNSDVFLSSNGNQIAFVVKLGSNETLFVNGKEIASDKDIIPIGFWETGEFVYVQFDGIQYALYIGQRRLESNKRDIPNVKINPECNFIAYSYITLSGISSVSSYSDKYYEPSSGRPYDFIYNLVIHPYEEMFAYCAGEQNKVNVVFNNTAYPAGNSIAVPKFTSEGKELFYVGCEDNNCFVNINGMQTKLKGSFTSEGMFLMKGGSKTLSYLTSTNLVLMNLENKMMHAGKMMDKLLSIRFNTMKNQYEALGIINNSIWLLYCQ